MKIVASKADISIEEYIKRLTDGYKWCYHCKTFELVGKFGKDSSRYDGLTPLCMESKNYRSRKRYIPVPAELIRHGPLPKPSRDQDKVQARQRINVLVRTGKIPHPNTRDCFDCSHMWIRGGRRHEYDHYLGYKPEFHYKVQPVCSKCHAAREKSRGIYSSKKRSNDGRFTKR
jgi:hypothetical protein